MSTVGQTIRDALLVLRVIDRAEAPEAADMADGIRTLNRMMNSWETEGLSVGWVNVNEANDDLGVPEESEEAIVYNLALMLRPTYGATLDQDTLKIAAEGISRLRSQVTSSTWVRVQYPDLPIGENQVNGAWWEGYYR